MRRRWKVLLGILVLSVGLLVAFEMHRRSQVIEDFVLRGDHQAKNEANIKAMDPEALLKQYSEPAEFARLCTKVAEANIAMEDRHRLATHLEHHRAVEHDKSGKEINEQVSWERVWYEGSKEFRQPLTRVEEAGKEVVFKDNGPAKVTEPAKVCFPFTKEAIEGSYRYKLDGHEILGDKLTVIVRFDPHPPLDNRFRGRVWVDPETFNPVRVEAVVAKNPPFVDKVSMLFEYGKAETGAVQAKHSVIGGSGGFAIVHKSYAVHSDLSDYRVNESSNSSEGMEAKITTNRTAPETAKRANGESPAP